MNYRFGGKAKTMAMGVFPLITLAEAREKREEARKLLTAGSDPCAMRKEIEAQEAFEATTGFRTVAEEWLAKREREGLGDITIGKIKWLLEFAYPSLGDRKIGEITSMEVLAVLRQVEGRGRHETARRLRSVCGRVFRYAIATGRAEHDLSANLRDALTTPKVKHLAAITSSQQVGPLLRAIDGFDGHAVTTAALRLAPHVFVRPGELRHAEWSEIDFEKALWSIPAEKMKMRRPHRVPLSRQAQIGLRLFDGHAHAVQHGRGVPFERGDDIPDREQENACVPQIIAGRHHLLRAGRIGQILPCRRAVYFGVLGYRARPIG